MQTNWDGLYETCKFFELNRSDSLKVFFYHGCNNVVNNVDAITKTTEDLISEKVVVILTVVFTFFYYL